MFGLFKTDPLKKLRKEHDKILEEAMHAQRKSNIRLYATLTAQADEVYQKIKALEV